MRSEWHARLHHKAGFSWGQQLLAIRLASNISDISDRHIVHVWIYIYPLQFAKCGPETICFAVPSGAPKLCVAIYLLSAARSCFMDANETLPSISNSCTFSSAAQAERRKPK